MKEETKKLIEQRHGGASPEARARAAIKNITDILWPKLTDELRNEGYGDDDADEEGHLLDEFAQWSADTIEEVAREILLAGFGPSAKVEYELSSYEDDDDEEE